MNQLCLLKLWNLFKITKKGDGRCSHRDLIFFDNYNLMSVLLATSFSNSSISVPLTLDESGWYYMNMGFGSSHQPAKIALDSMSAFLAVSSDICFHCPSQAYQPGLSKTTHNTGY